MTILCSSLSLCLSFNPYISISIYLSVYISFYLSIPLSLFLSIYPSISLSIYLSLYLTLYLSFYPSKSLSISIYLFSLSLSQSICLSIPLSFYPSIFLSLSFYLLLSFCLSPYFNPQTWIICHILHIEAFTAKNVESVNFNISTALKMYRWKWDQIWPK